MLCSINSIGLIGLDAYHVTIEVDIANGMPAFEIVGLPDAAVKESKDRVRAAMKNCGYELPARRITVNLAPANTKKTGPIYDLPILIGLLQATGQLNYNNTNDIFIGELSLGGEIRRCNGILPMVLHAKQLGFQRVFVPLENIKEASVVQGVQVYGVDSVTKLTSFLAQATSLEPAQFSIDFSQQEQNLPDFADVKGQEIAKRALEIAAAGGHNALLIGPPGSGKSMLAKRLPSILPKMTFEEAIETTKIHSIAGILPENCALTTVRPFRSPHHTISASGLTGGGIPPKPGEISLAHNGVLFLDELPELHRDAKEVLRAPIEDRVVQINRANITVSYPCSTMIIAAMNPCPCGYYGHPTRECSCSASKVRNYLNKISGPLLDRLDLHIEVAPVEFDQLSSQEKSEPSCDIRARVEKARKIQQNRYQGLGYYCNAMLPTADLEKFCVMTDQAKQTLKQAFEKMSLSARAYDRILKVSRTIADLANRSIIQQEHIFEAIQYRSLDRKYWSAY